MITLNVNGKLHKLEIPDDMPLLWTLRDVLAMTGTKFGCGAGLCGACTIQVDGQPVRSCITQASSAVGKKIMTIEAIGTTPAGRKIQRAWAALDVPQCGYCQSGQIMSAAALLAMKPKPGDSDIDAAMAGNLCRCGTYSRIRAAIKQAAGMSGSGPSDAISRVELSR
jgi:isoquinoline 1-oxidoreductase subunit alpha